MDTDLFDLFESIPPEEISLDSDFVFDDMTDELVQVSSDDFSFDEFSPDEFSSDAFSDDDLLSDDFSSDAFPDDEFSIVDYADQLSDDSLFASDADDQIEQEDLSDVITSNVPDDVVLDTSLDSSWFDDSIDSILRVCDDFYYKCVMGCDDIVTEHHFSDDGSYDIKNDVVVEGNVVHDMQFTQQQTHGSCSLMAQEQFVHRYIGRAIPEDYLEWAAEKWGVYSPDIGTSEDGHTMVLEHFNIPYEQYSNMEIQDLSNAISDHQDIIIGVDAREFYGDPSIPPGSGHAVAVIGQGINPATHEVEGFYVTDSNFPESAHFISVEKMASSWWNDMITVPELTA